VFYGDVTVNLNESFVVENNSNAGV